MTAMTAHGHTPEIALSAAWQAQRFTGPLRTVDGRVVEVVHRGTWTHGFGPDFRDAMILLDGRELRAGSVEVHLRTGAWAVHGHHLDPRYDDVSKCMGSNFRSRPRNCRSWLSRPGRRAPWR